MSEREERFERMLEDVKRNYAEIVRRMEGLKAEGKTKSATYRQLMGNKLNCQYVLSLYKAYGLMED